MAAPSDRVELVPAEVGGGIYPWLTASATNFPGDLSEFDAAGLEREPSVFVAPPRVRA
jgi:hypothetical protein